MPSLLDWETDMSRRPTAAHNLALRAAEAAVELDERDEPAPAASVEPASTNRPRGRPKGRRAVEARLTLYLDEKRHAALVRMAEDRGRSIHSLILEGVDLVIGKPVISGWK
jgi:hypothetical protein